MYQLSGLLEYDDLLKAVKAVTSKSRGLSGTMMAHRAEGWNHDGTPCSNDNNANNANAYDETLISIMTVFFFLDKKNSSSNSGAEVHRFGLCSQRSVSI
jgi:hypothetical protein